MYYSGLQAVTKELHIKITIHVVIKIVVFCNINYGKCVGGGESIDMKALPPPDQILVVSVWYLDIVFGCGDHFLAM